jgi:hypothetical protein
MTLLLIFRLVMALVCWGEVGSGVYDTASHTWYSTDLMVCAYLVQVPVVLLGVFWTLATIVSVVDLSDARARP